MYPIKLAPTLRKKAKKTLKLLLCNSEEPAHQKHLCAVHQELQQLNSWRLLQKWKIRKARRKGDSCQPKSIHELTIGLFYFLKSPECMRLCISQSAQKKNHFFLILWCINLHQLECTVSFCKAHVTEFAFMFYWFCCFLPLQYTAPCIVTFRTFHLTELALNVLLPFRFQAAVK